MNKLTKEVQAKGCFIFFNEYEDDRFEDFVIFVTTRLGVSMVSRFEGPYSSIVDIEYCGSPISLTSGSYEGCYMRVGPSNEIVADKIISLFVAVD